MRFCGSAAPSAEPPLLSVVPVRFLGAKELGGDNSFCPPENPLRPAYFALLRDGGRGDFAFPVPSISCEGH